jgi:hypothetical protein
MFIIYSKKKPLSIWKWVQKYSNLAKRFVTDDIRAVREEMFVDKETLLKIDGQNY